MRPSAPSLAALLALLYAFALPTSLVDASPFPVDLTPSSLDLPSPPPATRLIRQTQRQRLRSRRSVAPLDYSEPPVVVGAGGGGGESLAEQEEEGPVEIRRHQELMDLHSLERTLALQDGRRTASGSCRNGFVLAPSPSSASSSPSLSPGAAAAAAVECLCPAPRWVSLDGRHCLSPIPGVGY